jgi:hypothetical protein
MRGGRRKEER